MSKTFAGDGKTEVFNIPGHPLMVRAVDFNAAIGAEKRQLESMITLDLMQRLTTRAYEAVMADFANQFSGSETDIEAGPKAMLDLLRAELGLPSDQKRFNNVETNILNGIASWLETRSEYQSMAGNQGLMKIWAKDIREMLSRKHTPKDVTADEILNALFDQ